MTRPSPNYSSPERVLDMLLALGEPDTRHSMHSIARAFTSPGSTLQTRRKRALIEEDGRAGHNRLGRQAPDIARTAHGDGDLVAVAEPIMRALAASDAEHAARADPRRGGRGPTHRRRPRGARAPWTRRRRAGAPRLIRL